MAQAFDPASGKIGGAARVTRETVRIDRSTWNATITASDNGILVYGLGGRAGTNRLIWFDRSGARIKTLTGLGNILNIDLSHDGRRVAYEWQQLPLADIWSIDVVTGTRSRITTNPDDETYPVWLADGKRVAYAGRRDERYRLFITRANGSGTGRNGSRIRKKTSGPSRPPRTVCGWRTEKASRRAHRTANCGWCRWRETARPACSFRHRTASKARAFLRTESGSRSPRPCRAGLKCTCRRYRRAGTACPRAGRCRITAAIVHAGAVTGKNSTTTAPTA